MKTIDRVRTVIADALYLDQEQVTKDSTLMKDLGAESIDFLDIIFRIEKEFAIKLPKGDIERRARGKLTDAEFAVDGKLTPQGLASIREAMPEVNPEALRPGLHLRDIPTLFTVATFSRMVEQQLFGSSEVSLTGTDGRSESVAGSRG